LRLWVKLAMSAKCRCPHCGDTGLLGKVRASRGAAFELAGGAEVEVYSRTLQTWIPATLDCSDGTDQVYAEFQVDQTRFRKPLAVCSCADTSALHSGPSPELNLSGNFTVTEAKRLLARHLTINGERLRPCSLREVRRDYQVGQPINSFVLARVLEVDSELMYDGPFDEDVLLKVYALDGSHPWDEFQTYVLCAIGVKAGQHLGLVAHRNLNKDWLWPMRDQEPERYLSFLNRSTQGGYGPEGRNDVLGAAVAQQADYLISFCAADKEKNDALLRLLSSEPVEGPHCTKQATRPITFCTDRSLGFGGHYDAPAGLYLAKHGFAQPTAQRAWFNEYKEAGRNTAHGILVLNPSVGYLQSVACAQELLLCNELGADFPG